MIPIRRHSFFSGYHLSFSQVVKLIYYWTYQYPQHIVLHETGLSNKTVIDFYNFCREVCVVILENHSEPTGGPGRIVEIDESKFGKQKFNRGKKVDGVWVFGGIETVIHRVASLKLSLIDQPRHSFLSSRVGFCWAQQSIQTAGARTLPSSPKATYIPL